MYSNQQLGAHAGARSRANPWDVRNEAAQNNPSQQISTVQVQGIQNDFILDKTTIRWLRLPNSNEILDLNFKFEVKSPTCTLTFYQKVEEVAEVDPASKQEKFISFQQVNPDNAGFIQPTMCQFPDGKHEFHGHVAFNMFRDKSTKCDKRRKYFPLVI